MVKRRRGHGFVMPDRGDYRRQRAQGRIRGGAAVKKLALMLAPAIAGHLAFSMPKRRKKSKAMVKYKPQAQVEKKQNKRIRNLEKRVNQNDGLYIHRKREVCRLTTSAKESSFSNCVQYGTTDVEGALANLKYYDASNPGVLLTAAGATGTYKRDFMIKSIRSQISVHNNFIEKVKITVYCYEPKVDTSIAPEAAFTNGLADAGAPSSTSPLVYPSDSPQLRDLWKVKYKKSMFMRPGQSLSHTCWFKGFEYDPSLYDSHTTTYNKGKGAHVWAVRVEGGIAHDAAGLINNINTAIDVVGVVETKISYPAGIDLEYLEISDNAQNMAAGLIAYQPVPDILGYAAT